MIPSAALVTTHADLLAVLDAISFAPSCLALGWRWHVEWHDEAGWLVRCSFDRPDTDSGEVGRGAGRLWFVERGATVGAVVKTAWSACRMVVEHELHEAFLFHGDRVFDPHADVDALAAVSRARRTSP